MKTAYQQAASQAAQIIEIAARAANEPFLKFVERCALKTGTSLFLSRELSNRLQARGVNANDELKPDHKDDCEVYLLKASQAYLSDCMSFLDRGEGYDPKAGFNNWVGQNKTWLFNDAERQVLTIAFHTNSKTVAALNI